MRGVLVLFTLAGAALVAACHDDAGAPSERSKPPLELLPSVAGDLVSKPEMELRTRELARSIALALAEDTVRGAVFDALQLSTDPEHKLHFATLLADEGVLGDEMSRRSGKPTSELRSLLLGVLDLEFYMPVDEHRAQWRGGDDVIVATVLDDDGSIPVAYDLQGTEFFLDPDVPPTTPTLALVPSEQDFASESEVLEIARDYSGGDGIYMVYSSIWDDFEGYLMGDPEFELHAFVENASGDLEDVSCAGNGQSSPYKADFNDGVWTGEVMIISEEDADTGYVELQFWEDDNDGCTSSGGRPPKVTDPDWDDLLEMASTGYKAYEYFQSGQWWKLLGAGGGFLKAGYDFYESVNNDDLVGLIKWPPAGCWPESSGPIYGPVLSEDSGHALQGYVKLDNNFAARDSTCSLSASMTGPSWKPSTTSCRAPSTRMFPSSSRAGNGRTSWPSTMIATALAPTLMRMAPGRGWTSLPCQRTP